MFIKTRVTDMAFILLLFVTLKVAAVQLEAALAVDDESSSSSGGGGSSSSSIGRAWQRAKDYVSGVINGARKMQRAYNDMKEANWKKSDKYFHARGNADAATHGTGGRHAAKFISDAREAYGFFKGDSAADRAADQRANEHGRNGGDPNKYRPIGLPKKYKK
ncbi:serum amyloid A-5 protein-like [Ruditapes philippinarum]|uniref:serum amyloid A-5 protein-like n=1 Tax=Ruditapes philippinarum TaxID=129788 RepID=UPI00295A9AE3|nr:serum amyloid A-5 protein-like [Ruditapes philippinarum]XP_060606836.1 serum amyloid A-5 protein-like [Ruditapes philippinarum]